MTKTMIIAVGLALVWGGGVLADTINAPNAIREADPPQMADAITSDASQAPAWAWREVISAIYTSPSPTPEYIATHFVFVLPSIPAGHIVLSADLSFDVVAVQNPSLTAHTAVDLYGVKYVANLTADDTTLIYATDHYGGPYAESGNNGTGIQDDILPISNTSTNVGRYDTDGPAELALGTWITAQYNAGALPGDYIFLRLSPDRAPEATSRGYDVAAADHSNSNLWPKLVLETGEPPPPLAISSASIGDATAIAFDSVTNTTYALQFTVLPSTTHWTSAGATMVGDGGTLQFFDPAGYSTTKLYRVIGVE